MVMELQRLSGDDALEVHETIMSSFGTMDLAKDLKRVHEVTGDESLPHMSRETEKAPSG
jgi:hypothetical protein